MVDIVARPANGRSRHIVSAPIHVARPPWSKVYAGYPKDGDHDLPEEALFISVFGPGYDRNIFSNGCATRLSIALLHGGMRVNPEFPINESTHRFNKQLITVSATNMINWLNQVWGKADVVITAIDRLHANTLSDVAIKIGNRNGVYAMRPFNPSNRGIDPFDASGHVTIWVGNNVFGGHHYIDRAREIYFWELK
jgi:Type VI secretion system (T6SS), amidase effector protein 4